MDMQVVVTRRYHFESSHFLPLVPEGHKCRNMHGHNYEIEVSYRGYGGVIIRREDESRIDVYGIEENGMAVDFFDLDAIVEPIIKQLDHTTLNNIVGLSNPTAELIGVWILNHLQARGVESVRVWETPTCSAIVSLGSGPRC